MQVPVQVEDGEACGRVPSTSTCHRVRRIERVRPRGIRDAEIGTAPQDPPHLCSRRPVEGLPDILEQLVVSVALHHLQHRAPLLRGRCSSCDARKQPGPKPSRQQLPDGYHRRQLCPSFGGNAAALPLFDSLPTEDRKSTRLNSSHGSSSYAVFCLKKKKR